jgi:hypothetical protein
LRRPASPHRTGIGLAGWLGRRRPTPAPGHEGAEPDAHWSSVDDYWPRDSADPYFAQPFIEIEPSEVAELVQGGTQPPGPGAATRRPALAGRTNAIVVGRAGAARQ